MREATDLEISAGVRRELSGRRVDLSKLKFHCVGGVVTLNGELSFVELEKSPEETAIELKFLDSCLRGIRGVKSLVFNFENWSRTETGKWEAKNAVAKGGGRPGVISGEGVHCPSCDSVIRFCPCCGKPLSGSETPVKAAPAIAGARGLPRRPDFPRPVLPKAVIPGSGLGTKPGESKFPRLEPVRAPSLAGLPKDMPSTERAKPPVSPVSKLPVPGHSIPQTPSQPPVENLPPSSPSSEPSGGAFQGTLPHPRDLGAKRPDPDSPEAAKMTVPVTKPHQPLGKAAPPPATHFPPIEKQPSVEALPPAPTQPVIEAPGKPKAQPLPPSISRPVMPKGGQPPKVEKVEVFKPQSKPASFTQEEPPAPQKPAQPIPPSIPLPTMDESGFGEPPNIPEPVLSPLPDQAPVPPEPPSPPTPEAPPVDLGFDESLLPPLKPASQTPEPATVPEAMEDIPDLPPIKPKPSAPLKPPVMAPKPPAHPSPLEEADLPDLPPLKPQAPPPAPSPKRAPVRNLQPYTDDETPLPPMKPPQLGGRKPPTPQPLPKESADEDIPLPPLKPQTPAPAASTSDEDIPLPPIKPKAPTPKPSPGKDGKATSDDLFASLFDPAAEKSGKAPAKEPKIEAGPGKESPDDLMNLDLGMLDLFQKPQAPGAKKPAAAKPPAKPDKPGAPTKDDPLNLAGILEIDDADKAKGKKGDPGGNKDPFSIDDFDITKFKV